MLRLKFSRFDLIWNRRSLVARRILISNTARGGIVQNEAAYRVDIRSSKTRTRAPFLKAPLTRREGIIRLYLTANLFTSHLHLIYML